MNKHLKQFGTGLIIGILLALLINGVANAAVATEHFNIENDYKLACTCDDPECDKRTVLQSLLDRVQLVRNDANRPLIVTSGGRCPQHPVEKHRTVPAEHQKGQGIDVKVTGGYERAELIRLGIKHGFNAIGVGETFVHLGYREGLPLVIWIH